MSQLLIKHNFVSSNIWILGPNNNEKLSIKLVIKFQELQSVMLRTLRDFSNTKNAKCHAVFHLSRFTLKQTFSSFICNGLNSFAINLFKYRPLINYKLLVNAFDSNQVNKKTFLLTDLFSYISLSRYQSPLSVFISHINLFDVIIASP